MADLLERLRRGDGPPLRVSEMALVLDCSVSTARKLIYARTSAVRSATLRRWLRIDVADAAALARELGVRF